ncbi:adenosylcobinamide-GDP ribazoletransferase [Nocardia abscessus]|uniref:Adenosylcobinamide-GDP ribazoletransferase n=1 Tax=Nocardia abscessus TaxID=120957 RepID=A0ABS0C8S6_9NOCA|nr:adenosylcobinamide-GDP ribazoletransferase [Nocardia abscessus]MBF6226196.1 adenosylcobinamide-GDP ribazoletransferase [Nocardia abscessus]
MNGVRLAISWLTVLPVRGPETVDRSAARRAILLAPLVGALLGAGAAGLLWALTRVGTSASLAGLLVVGALALITRGMHLDGLADTLDGLGSYGPPERARQIMKSGGAGPFGVAGLTFTIGVQAFSFAALADSGRWLAVALAVATGRVAVILACRGIPAAPGTGFGVLVAGTQSAVAAVCWPVAAVALAVFTVPGYPWLGPLAVTLGLATSMILVRHCARRFGGVSGDVLGAAVETTVALTAAVLSLAVRTV